MALTSPRFKTSQTLVNVEAGAQTLQVGSDGRHVHLIQVALLDLGFKLPRSTKNPKYSPDGIFGDETKQVVKEFQAKAKLKDDGIVGQKTMRELDRQLPGFSHRVKLHFRSLALTNVPFEKSLRNAEEVFGQYGIQVMFASGESLLLTPDQHDKFKQIDQECNWALDSGEFNELQKLGSPAPKTDVMVFHVLTFADGNVLGCGGHAADRPACTITASALAWDTAHEVGHVLLTSSFAPVHIEDKRNLMFPISRSSATMPVLTNGQIAQMKKSPCCKAI